MADKDRISEILSDNGDMDPELLEKISNSCNTLSDEQKNRIFDIVQQKEFADNSENQYEESVNVVEYRRFSMIKYIAAIAACACVILSVSIFSGRNKENILSGNDKVRVTTVCVTERPETSAFTDVSVSQDVSQTARPAVTAVTGNGVQPAVITVTDIKNKQAVTSAKTERQNTATSEVTSAYETTGTVKPYPYPEDIDDSAEASVNEDGTIKISFENGQFEMLFPADFANHFVIRDMIVYSKIAYTEGYSGKLMSFSLEKEFYDGIVKRPVGYSGGKYLYYQRPTDCKCNEDDKEQLEEFSRLYGAIDDFVSLTFRSRSVSGEMKREFPVPENLTGKVIADVPGEEIYAYSLESILSENSGLKKVWKLEEGWNITALECVYSSILWLKCRDTDDGDEYGWVSAWNLDFQKYYQTYEYKTVYKELLDELRFETEGIDDVRYFIQDMNNDEIPELITITGTCEADFTTTFYTIKYHKAEVIGEDFRGDHSFFEIDERTGSFCIESCWNGVGSVVSYVYDGVSVKEGKSIKDLSYMYDDEYENAVSEMFDLRNYGYGRAFKNGESFLVTADFEEIRLNDNSYTFTD